ncbi:hypothetical protein [Metapseudomonas resinovorans]|uniref:Lipoprotein n=1 Tax=Metapseudomonas resinovorans NBRC 106553 TaxID=1245471 RepID=S6AQR6_METRE|nr:hypothetical protein [Pseudomonas resinovorans]BAN48128.1 hypothetical protein PCA10_23960 [Pseudomonas resinovorans NBRC 106553]
MLIVILAVTLGGCASKPPPAPPVVVSQSTWRQVDRDIAAASLVATDHARTYAQDSMERWMDLVYQRTDAEFLPWFSSFWTRKWLGMKVTWYRLDANGEREEIVNRLASYLQEEYDEQVLEPVSRELDPDDIMEQATRLYIQQLDHSLQQIPTRFGVPADQFDQHLQKIPAIELAPPGQRASLFQVLNSDPLEELPAFAGLMQHIRNAPSGAGAWATDAGLSSITHETSEQLTSEMATSGAASVVTSMLGKVAGPVLSFGFTGISAMLNEESRPEREAKLRKSLSEAFDEEWLELMRNHDTGVMAGVFHLSGQVERSLGQPKTQPIPFEPAPRVVPVPWD